MARINIEEELWSDPRFLRLCVLVGDEMKAIGAIVLAWKTAQKYWCPNRKPIPKDVFNAAGLPTHLITAGLAEEVDDGIRMRGAEEHFAWWFQRQEAGKKGGQATAKRKAATAKRSGGEIKQIQPSYSYSNNYVCIGDNSENREDAQQQKSNTENHPANVFERRFTVKPDDLEAVENYVNQAFLGRVPPRIANRIPDLAAAFGTADNFATHLTEILADPRASPDVPKFRSFIEGCLLRQIEVIK